MTGKYCDYYWSIKKEKDGYVWNIRASHKKGVEIIQSSLDKDWSGCHYYEFQSDARSDVYEAIQDYYT